CSRPPQVASRGTLPPHRPEHVTHELLRRPDGVPVHVVSEACRPHKGAVRQTGRTQRAPLRAAELHPFREVRRRGGKNQALSLGRLLLLEQTFDVLIRDGLEGGFHETAVEPTKVVSFHWNDHLPTEEIDEDRIALG